MPVVNLQILSGLSRQQKEQIISEFTETLSKVADKKPEHTHIIITETTEENWGYAGLPTDKWRK